MDQTTFADAAVAAFFKENYVSLKIDAEKGEGPDLKDRFEVQGYPTFVLADAQGKEIDRIVGFMPTEPFLKTLKDFQAGNTFQNLQREIQKNPNDPNLLYALGLKWRERGDNEKAQAHLEKVLSQDPGAKNEKTILAKRELAMIVLEEERNANDLIDFAKAYPDPKYSLNAHRALVQVYENAGNLDAAEESFEFVLKNGSANDAEWLNGYAWFLATNDRKIEKATELAAKAVELSPKSYHILDTLAECYFRTKQYAKAVETQKKAIELIANEKEKKQYEKRLRQFEEAAASKS